MGASDSTVDAPSTPAAGEDPRSGPPQATSRIDLARTPPIRLGVLRIDPARRRIAHDDGREEIVEPRVMQVLVALAHAGGQILTRDDLLMSCWHGVVVGEDAINRVISRLRRLADGIGANQFKLETVTKVGYRLVPANASAEAGEAAPSRDTPPLAPATARDTLLAVLAFDNLSGEPDMLWFSDGVSEEIQQSVARGAALKVVGRGSSFQFRGPDKAAAHVSTVLKATHVLDGSVRRSGDRVRISAQLIECAGETTLWSDRFDRDLTDIFALQDEIAGAVADALKVVFAPGAPREPIDPAAYNLYLKALEIRNRGLEASTLPEVIGLLTGATEKAPTFARAWVFLATMLAELLDFDAPYQPHALTRARLVTAAQRALELDPALGGAYQALGQLQPLGAYFEREALHRKALAVAPNDPTVLANTSLFFAEVGRVREALAFARAAYDLDPMFPWVTNWLASLLADYALRLDEGRALWEKLLALRPDNKLIAWSIVLSAAGHGDWARFDMLVAVAHERGLDSAPLRRVIYFGETRRNPGPEIRESALRNARENLVRKGALPLGVFTDLYSLGLKDEMFELIDEASFAFMLDPDQRSPYGAFGGSGIFSAVFDGGIKHDPRFIRLCAKLGLCAYWVKSDCWPDCAETLAAEYDFRAEVRRAVAV